MNILRCLKMAVNNIFNHKKFYIKMTIPIILISFLLLFCSLYAINVTRQIDYRYNRFFSRYFGQIETSKPLNDTLISIAKNNEGINDFKCTISLYNDEFIFFQDLTLDFEGTKYQTDYEYDFSIPDFSMSFVENSSHISKNEIKELSYRHNKDVMLFGEYNISGNNAVINEILFKIYGLTANEEMIGKTISFYKNQEKFFDLTITGITTEYLFKTSYSSRNLIGMSTENELYLQNSELEKEYNYKFYFKDFLSAQKAFGFLNIVFPNEKIDFPYELEIIVNTALYTQKEIITKFVRVILIILLFTFLLNLIFNIKMNLDKNQGYIGMMRGLGITNLKMYLILLFEFLIILIFALLVGSLLSILSLNIINIIFNASMLYKQLSITFNLQGFLLLILQYLGIFIILSIVMSFFAYKIISRKSIVTMLVNK